MNLKNFVRETVNLNSDENKIIASYLKDINKYKKPTKEEEQELIYRYQYNGDIEARNELVKRNQKFIYAVAKRYRQDKNIMDLISEGNIGLIEAMDSYDYNKNATFLTYAIWYVRRAMVQYITNNASQVYKTNKTLTDGKIEKIENDFILQNGRTPTQEEIIDILKEQYNVKIKNTYDLNELKIESIDINYKQSNDDFGNDEPVEYQITASVDNDYELQTENDYNETYVTELMKCLTEREKKIIILAYGLDGSGKGLGNFEIGEEMDLTTERVRQLKNGAIKKMQEISKSLVFA